MAKNRPLSRRTLLAGAGTLLALPALEAMWPTGRASAAATSPLRMFTFHFPIGVNRAAWKATGTETSWTLGQSQAPLAPHQNDLCVVTGVNNAGDTSGTAGHTCNMATFLTALDVPAGISGLGTSADQMIAEKLKGQTRLRSLELGTSVLYENPNAEAGYDPVLKDHLSWNNNTPLPKEVDPGKVWDRLFAGTDPNATSAEVARRKHYGQSVIDAVRGDATALQSKLGKADNAKLDQYLSGVRELELRIAATAGGGCAAGARPGAPADIRQRVTQMLDMMVLAAMCDVTRVMTFSYENTVTEQTHPWLGVNEGYHIGVTHNQPGAPYVTVNTWLVSQLAYLLNKMKQVTEPGGTLLDNSIVYFASELGEGSSHDDSDLPIVIAGRAGGKLTPGRLLSRQGNGNGNVLISFMRAFGLPATSFGNGFTQPVPGLFSA